MKKLVSIVFISSLTFSAASHAEDGWFGSLKSMLGFGDSAEEQVEMPAMPSADGLMESLQSSLGVTSEQAEGGMASIMNYVKNNASEGQFSELSSAIPGLDSIMSSVPSIEGLGSSDALSGVMSKVSEYSDSLKGINELKQQFEALGLKPEMIMGFIEQAKAYLDTEQGQAAKELLTSSLGDFDLSSFL
ncbi:DUF2780 domain-containing protein [Glaciecola sp. MH2013]|uniref:DUF2780 domain-containing protein n=1 Tax=Glaciecola sp. MH2013 TaxID=2785524 RepID=UPI0018A03A92|nr:DUF2780 domain-containing protein [Glaciecola sp. MH2013]MBF7072111.1 DUF2780 domain-containing protein [Glaciecola sp. MH2013]